MASLKLGCIADDFTGATDLANNLVRAGMRVVQTIGTPTGDLPAAELADVDAVVVALKSRTIPAADAVAESLTALAWLRAHGAEQIYFKYCSTFDSTSAGNIGPVTDALMSALDTDFTVAVPAFPDTGRTVFKGHLFVGDELLSDSGMRNHPVTPMTDANLVRVLQAQTRAQVGLIDFATVARGESALRSRVRELRANGVRMAVVDAISNDDLVRMGPVLRDLPLITAGSGVAIGLPATWGIKPSERAWELPPATGLQAVVSGSCSVATNDQVRTFIADGGAAFPLDPLRIGAGEDVVTAALAWARGKVEDQPVLVYSTAEPRHVREVQGRLGTASGELVEATLAAIAAGLVELGVRQLVVAGGETAGAVVRALGLTRLQVGPQIDPGVPWCAAPLPGGGTLHVALKSGNFGTPDFFSTSFATLLVGAAS